MQRSQHPDVTSILRKELINLQSATTASSSPSVMSKALRRSAKKEATATATEAVEQFSERVVTIRARMVELTRTLRHMKDTNTVCTRDEDPIFSEEELQTLYRVGAEQSLRDIDDLFALPMFRHMTTAQLAMAELYARHLMRERVWNDDLLATLPTAAADYARSRLASDRREMRKSQIV
jgi:hypothetical protein